MFETKIKQIDFTLENFRDILINETYKDLRIGKMGDKYILKIDAVGGSKLIYINNYSVELFFDYLKKLTKDVFFKSFKKGVDGKLRFFSFHLPVIDKETGKTYQQGFRGVLKFSVKGIEITIRQLVKKGKIENIIKDQKLLTIILQGLTSKKSMIISGRPGSGKSTILISLLEYFNNNTFNSILTKLFFEYIYEIINNNETNTLKTMNINSNNIGLIKKELSKFKKIDKKIIFEHIRSIEFALTEYFFYQNKDSKTYLINDYINEIIKILDGELNEEYEELAEIIKNNIKIVEMIKNIVTILKAELKLYFEVLLLKDPLLRGLEIFNKLRYRNVNTLENPVEYIFEDNYLMFYQHDVGVHLNNN